MKDPIECNMDVMVEEMMWCALSSVPRHTPGEHYREYFWDLLSTRFALVLARDIVGVRSW